MISFGPKLQPGERVVWRDPAAFTRLGWMFVVAFAAALGLATLAIDLWVAKMDGDGLAVIRAVGAALFTLLVLAQVGSWRILVTDRRVLVRRAAIWRAPAEVPLDDIEDVHANIAAGHIVAQGHGERVRLPVTPENLPDLRKAIQCAKGEAA